FPAVMTGPADAIPDVLLMHPAVEHPDLHEAPVVGLPYGRPRRLGALLVVHPGQGLLAGRGDLGELGQDLVPAAGGQGGDPDLVEPAYVVAHVLWPRGALVALGVGPAEERGLGPDHVGVLGRNRPPGARGGGGPLVVGQGRAQLT